MNGNFTIYIISAKFARNNSKSNEKSPLVGFWKYIYEGGRRIWTDDQAFAEPCLTTWLYRRDSYYSIVNTCFRQESFIVKAENIRCSYSEQFGE